MGDLHINFYLYILVCQHLLNEWAVNNDSKSIKGELTLFSGISEADKGDWSQEDSNNKADVCDWIFWTVKNW